MKVIFLDVDGVLNSAQDGYSIRLKTDSHLKLLQYQKLLLQVCFHLNDKHLQLHHTELHFVLSRTP